MKSMTTIILVAAILAAGLARADDENLVYGPVPEGVPEQDLKSPGMATGLSVGGFLFPVVMMVAMSAGSSGGSGDSPMAALVMVTGSILGPGLGHAYAGNKGQFWKGAGLRTLGYGGFLAAVAASWDNSDSSGVGGLAVVSSVLYLASSIYDMATADNSAKKYNERLEASRVSVLPTWAPEDDAVGVRVALGF